MRRVFCRSFVFALLCMMPIAFSSCGSSSSGGGDSGGGGGDGTPTTRTVTGTIGTGGAMVLSKALGAKVVANECANNICRVIATNLSDGTEVVDDQLASCRFNLPLVIGAEYVIAFETCDGAIAAVFTGNSSICPIPDGSTEMNMGILTFSGDLATGENNCFDFDDADGDGTSNADDDTPCGDYACAVFYSCEFFGYADEDEDGVCDSFEPENWSDDGWVTYAPTLAGCTTDADCTAGYFCDKCDDYDWMTDMGGYCQPNDYKCDANNQCPSGYYCYETCATPAFGFCAYVSAGASGCVSNADCVMMMGPGSTCDTTYGTCTFPAEECSTSDDCWYNPGAVCVGGACVGGSFGECYYDDQCGEGHSCIGFACVTNPVGGWNYCESNVDCSSGWECWAGLCTFTGGCVTDADCTAFYGVGYYCSSNYCVYSIPTCSSNADCDIGYYCDFTMSMCMPDEMEDGIASCAECLINCENSCSYALPEMRDSCLANCPSVCVPPYCEG